MNKEYDNYLQSADKLLGSSDIEDLIDEYS